MSGYFSQLARHTGLDPKVVAPGHAAEPRINIQRPATVATAAMHVEEISFTGAPVTHAPRVSSEEAAALPAHNRLAAATPDVPAAEREDLTLDAHMHGTAATAKGATDPSQEEFRAESDIAFTESNLAQRTWLPANTPTPARTDAPPAVDRRSPSDESVEVPSDSIEIVGRQSLAPHQQAQIRETQRTKAEDTGRSESRLNAGPVEGGSEPRAEPETTFANFLKEVRAWVSAPPELDQPELEWHREGERSPAVLGAGQSVPAGRDVFALEREAPTTAHHSNQSDPLDAQELNLSIGTISIVVEAPTQIAPSVPQAPPRVDSPRERSASEPTRLSRYYLERW